MTITPPTENSIPACRPRPGARGPRHEAPALVAAAALSAAPASAATPPRDFVGVTAWEPMSSTELGRLAGSKARVYRVLILWQQVERDAPQGDCTVRCTQYYDWE